MVRFIVSGTKSAGAEGLFDEAICGLLYCESKITASDVVDGVPKD